MSPRVGCHTHYFNPFEYLEIKIVASILFFRGRENKKESENEAPCCCFPYFHFISATFSAQHCMVANSWVMTFKSICHSHKRRAQKAEQSVQGWLILAQREKRYSVSGGQAWLI